MRFATPHEKPPVRMILDTDTYNEIDDQFALIFALLSPEVFDFRGVTAAPFLNERSTGAGDGMEKSYLEIRRILDLMGSAVPAFRGAAQFLPDNHTPVDSEAVRFIISEAKRARNDGVRLHLAGIGAITNIASALLTAPEIAADTTVVWLGGHTLTHERSDEFNLRGDVPAAQSVLNSGVDFVQYPCAGCVSALSIQLAELKKELAGCGEVEQYLVEIFDKAVGGDETRQRVIWDISVIAHFVLPQATTLATTPLSRLNHDCSWTPDPRGRLITVAQTVNRDAIFSDLFNRIRRFSQQQPQENGR